MGTPAAPADRPQHARVILGRERAGGTRNGGSSPERLYDATRKSGEQIAAEGKGKELRGKVTDALGDLTGNSRHDLAGKADQLEGKAQQRVGDAQSD